MSHWQNRWDAAMYSWVWRAHLIMTILAVVGFIVVMRVG